VTLAVNSTSNVPHLDDPSHGGDGPGDVITNSQFGPSVLFISGSPVFEGSPTLFDLEKRFGACITLLDSGDILSFTGTVRYTETYAVIFLNDPLHVVLDFNSPLVDQKHTRICMTLRVEEPR
jgi:hypothetical protein